MTNDPITPQRAQEILRDAFVAADLNGYRITETGIRQRLRDIDSTAYEAVTAILIQRSQNRRRVNERFDFLLIEESNRLADAIQRQTERRR